MPRLRIASKRVNLKGQAHPLQNELSSKYIHIDLVFISSSNRVRKFVDIPTIG